MTDDVATLGERARVGLERLAHEWRNQDADDALDDLESALTELRDIATGDHGYGNEGTTAMAIDQHYGRADKAIGRLRLLREAL